MSQRILPLISGDNRTLSLSAVHPTTRAVVVLPNTASLIFTAKRSVSDADADAVFQKTSSAGISFDGSAVTVSLVPNDTDGVVADVDLYCDLQAQDDSFGVLTVWSGILPVKAGVTRELASSVLIYTTNPAVPAGTTGYQEIRFGVNGGGTVVTTGLRVKAVMMYAGTVVGWGIVADVSGSIVMDVRNGTPSAGSVTTSSITGTGTPTLTGAQVATSTNVTGWSAISWAAGDVLEMVVTGTPATLTAALLTLKITR